MNTHLAPTYQVQFGDYWLLWYLKSNNYSVVEHDFKELLDYFLSASSKDEFYSYITETDSISNPEEIEQYLQLYLEDCNTTSEDYLGVASEFNISKCNITKFYILGEIVIRINYDSELVQKTIHPSIAHLEIKESEPQVVFDIYVDDELLCLFRDNALIKAIPKRDYHLLQGKFVMELFSILHNKKDKDWLCTFHGSTVSDGKNSILVIGESGKGKSTLCAILSASGFELVADDVSPMLAKNQEIFFNPSAISIKEGAFGILNPIVDGFADIPNVLFNKSKGKLKYIPCKQPLKRSYSCKSIIMVNYSKDQHTLLEPVSLKELLETLIPESWLSPDPDHARQFLDWLKSVYFYKLTYSDTNSMIKEFESLFKAIDKD